MPRNAEAIAKVMYKGIFWVFDRFFCQSIAEANWKILSYWEKGWVIDLQICFFNRFALIYVKIPWNKTVEKTYAKISPRTFFSIG